ncbi:hypothetical protein JL721_2087 [Aureococcus anophagefferens]|nr:hypothetical protein JL721_2087 [Aureococcus anophagefferens]
MRPCTVALLPALAAAHSIARLSRAAIDACRGLDCWPEPEDAALACFHAIAALDDDDDDTTCPVPPQGEFAFAPDVAFDDRFARDCACDPSLGLACAEARIAPWERDWRDLRCDLRCCAEAATRALGWDVAAKGQADPYGALVGGRSLRPFCDGELGWDRKRRAYAYRPLSPPPPDRAAVVVYFRGIGPGSRETRTPVAASRRPPPAP